MKTQFGLSEFLELRTAYHVLIIASIIVILLLVSRLLQERRRAQHREYYRNVYLQSDDWRRKRYVVLKRDNWKCVYCGAPATEVHHKKYAKNNIGKEPIDCLVSVCRACHNLKHN